MPEINIDIDYQPLQKSVFLSDAPWKGLECGRGYGKSYLMHSMLLQDMVEGKRCIMTAQTTHILGTQFMPALMNLAKKWGLPLDWKESKGYATLGKGIVFLGSYENFETALTGADGIASGYFDEIAKCKDFDWFLGSINPCFRASGFKPKRVFATTPKKGCRFDRWLKENQWVFVARGGTIDDNPHVTEEDRESMKMGLSGDLFRQEIMGEVLDGDIEYAVFPAALLGKPCKGTRGLRSMGVDCAGAGRDYNVFVVSDDFGILEKVKVQKADTFQLAATGRQLIDKWNVKLVNIDGTGGFGQGIFDMLSLQYDFVNSVNFGQSAVDNEHFANARAEMFTQLAKDCEGGFSVTDDEIIEELELISFDITNAGKKQLVPKETIKKVLGRSPDCSDALALSRYRRDGLVASVNSSVSTGDLVEEMSGW